MTGTWSVGTALMHLQGQQESRVVWDQGEGKWVAALAAQPPLAMPQSSRPPHRMKSASRVLSPGKQWGVGHCLVPTPQVPFPAAPDLDTPALSQLTFFTLMRPNEDQGRALR